jgi:hypothetical protein
MSATGLDFVISEFEEQSIRYLINLNPQKWPEPFLVERYENRLINENSRVRLKMSYWKAIQEYNK